MIESAKELDKSIVERDHKAADYLRESADRLFPNIKENGVYVERRLSVTVDDWEISGAQDIYFGKEALLNDYKFTSTYAYSNASEKVEWKWQMSIYAFMLRKNGFPCSKASIVMLFRDWSKSKSEQNRAYPKNPWFIHDINLASDEETETYIRERMRIHKLAESGVDVECTPHERWASADTFAVIKKGGKRAISGAIFADERSALNFIKDGEHKHGPMELDTRPGLSRKCISFCSVSQFCEQFKKETKKINDSI